MQPLSVLGVKIVKKLTYFTLPAVMGQVEQKMTKDPKFAG